VRAFEKGSRFAEPFEGARTVASGLRVPAAVGDFMILDAIRESGGVVMAVQEDCIVDWMREGVAAEGIGFCPESATCIGTARQLAASGWIAADEKVVIFNCGAAQKYPHLFPLNLPEIANANSVDWERVQGAGRAG